MSIYFFMSFHESDQCYLISWLLKFRILPNLTIIYSVDKPSTSLPPYWPITWNPFSTFPTIHLDFVESFHPLRMIPNINFYMGISLLK